MFYEKQKSFRCRSGGVAVLVGNEVKRGIEIVEDADFASRHSHSEVLQIIR